MRVLLTGATGFVGSHVLSQLEDHEVLCISRDPSLLTRRSGLRTVTADLGKDGDWTGKISAFKPDWCFHLAWEGLPDYSLACCRRNLNASLRFLDVVAQSGVRRVVVAGTCFEYGEAAGAVCEDDPPHAVGVFAATKRALLSVVASVAENAEFEYRWARLFFVYGPGQRPTSLIPHLRSAYAAGRAPEIREPHVVQDFVHVEDVATALVTLASADVPSGIFNVGSGQPTSVGRIANIAADHCGKLRPFETVREGRGFWADTSKMQASTGWHSQIGIDEGLTRTLVDLARQEA